MYNSGSRTDRLIGASTYIADRAELHTHEMKGDVMKMRPVEAVEIPAGGTVEFRARAACISCCWDSGRRSGRG